MAAKKKASKKLKKVPLKGVKSLTKGWSSFGKV
jgi:hypothetical protein